MEDKIKMTIDKLDNYEDGILNEIFENPDLTNIFLKNNQLNRLLFNYITTTKNKEYYEIVDYLKDNNIEAYNIFKFNNGKFTEIELDTLKNDKELNKMLNTILLFNLKTTNNKHYNKIFEQIKNVEISNYKFNELFNDIILNNIREDYNFKFMDKIIDKKTVSSGATKFQIIDNKVKLSFKYIDLMENYILKYNDDSKVFKMWFYILLSYVYDKPNLNFTELLNIFQNFNIIFYNKLIYPNTSEATLITYIYFKVKTSDLSTRNNINQRSDQIKYKPNLRYTIDIKGNDTIEKVNYLKEYNTIKQSFNEFNTTIEENETGIYFNTNDYKIDKILCVCQDLMDNKKYNELIYYIFNSQFLNRSTCLFGYFIYFYLTHNILKNTYYHDIIALTRPFNEFNEIIDKENEHITEFEKIDKLTLNNVIDLIN